MFRPSELSKFEDVTYPYKRYTKYGFEKIPKPGIILDSTKKGVLDVQDDQNTMMHFVPAYFAVFKETPFDKERILQNLQQYPIFPDIEQASKITAEYEPNYNHPLFKEGLYRMPTAAGDRLFDLSWDVEIQSRQRLFIQAIMQDDVETLEILNNVKFIPPKMHPGYDSVDFPLFTEAAQDPYDVSMDEEEETDGEKAEKVNQDHRINNMRKPYCYSRLCHRLLKEKCRDWFKAKELEDVRWNYYAGDRMDAKFTINNAEGNETTVDPFDAGWPRKQIYENINDETVLYRQWVNGERQLGVHIHNQDGGLYWNLVSGFPFRVLWEFPGVRVQGVPENLFDLYPSQRDVRTIRYRDRTVIEKPESNVLSLTEEDEE